LQALGKDKEKMGDRYIEVKPAKGEKIQSINALWKIIPHSVI